MFRSQVLQKAKELGLSYLKQPVPRISLIFNSDFVAIKVKSGEYFIFKNVIRDEGIDTQHFNVMISQDKLMELLVCKKNPYIADLLMLNDYFRNLVETAILGSYGEQSVKYLYNFEKN